MKNLVGHLLRINGLTIAALLLVVAGALFWMLRGTTTHEIQIHELAKDEIILVRTPGGMLEVSTLIKNEDFGWSTEHSCPPVDCSFLGKTVSQLRIPAHYTYRVPLAAHWTLRFKGSYYELKVPAVEPKLPVALDLAKIERRTDKGLLAPNTTEHRESMLKHLGPEVDRRAGQQLNIEAQREAARTTVGEFARKWMLEQGVDLKRKDLPIKVFFADEM